MRVPAKSGRFHGAPTGRLLLIAAAAIVLSVAVAGIVIALKWPFSRDAVIARLSKDTGAKVSIANFETTYLLPGFNARQLILTDRQNGLPILTARNFRVRANWVGLLHGELSSLVIDGFRVAVGKTHLTPHSENSDVATFMARNGSIQIASSDANSQPLQLTIHQLTIHNPGGSHPKFELDSATSQPPGAFRASGTLGALNSRNSSISAQYAYAQADLGVLGGITGTLASSGKISGTLERLQWNGTADIPNFLVSGSAHRVHLRSIYTVFLNTADASLDLEKIDVSFNRSTISAHGRIASEQPGAGKTLRLTANAQTGRVDDLLTLVSSDPRPSMTGGIRFHGDVVLPPSKERFLHRVKLNGTFEIDRALFTNPKTQSPLDYLSESSHDASRAQERRDPEQIPATIHGGVRDAEAVAHLEKVHYSMPGVDASIAGTFNLVSKAVLLQGVLTTTGELPDAASPMKAVLLSIARPLFGIHHKGKYTIVGFTISGTTKHPSLTLSHSKLARDVQHLSKR